MNRLLSAVLVLLAAACQTYDFEPVQPIAIAQTTQSKKVVAKNLKPNLMILVDKSGSMNLPVGVGPGAPTRIQELRTAMGQFLSTAPTVARMGLAFFPADNASFTPTGCAPTASIAVPLPAPSTTDTDPPLVANATQVNTGIQGVMANGGTPTAASLTYLGGYEPLLQNDNRQDFILLLTDGLPNCNPNNPLGCGTNPPPPMNFCTLNPVPNPMNLNNCMGQYCRAGYLDRDGVVAAIQNLRTRNISTIVVGFGADFSSPEALDVLNTMAETGGFARTCPMNTDAECGMGGRCLAGGVCQRKFYAASNARELTVALQNISTVLGVVDPCKFTLEEQPASEKFLAVIVDGSTVAPSNSTWRYQGGLIEFQGPLCDRVKNATPATPVEVEFRIVTTL